MADTETYTEPELRQRLKDEIQAGDRGGKRGQWSARKAQLLVQEYERAGGGYVDDGSRTESQQHLEDWGEQDWHGKGGATDSGGGRYLPDVAWALLSRSEREATDAPKRQAGEQFVSNTDAAKEARKAAELLTMTAKDAAKAVRAMTTTSALDRAERAERDHGAGRTTVLDAVAKRRTRL